MADSVVPGVLATDERLAPMAELTQRLSLLPVDGLLVDLVDLVSAPFLPHLAEQFHVLGLEGWSSGLAEADQRELVRNAIRLHRKKGTPWAIRTALASIGYPGSELIEYKTYREEWEAAGGRTLDGSWIADGSVVLSPPVGTVRRLAMRSWAEYAIRLNLAEGTWTRAQQRLVKDMAAQYAPVRCHLRALVTAVGSTFDSSITMLAPSQRLAIRMVQCRRFTVHNWQTLDGCWDVGGNYSERLLDGSWGLLGTVRLTGLQPAGAPLRSGFGEFRMRGRTSLPVPAAGGDRALPARQLWQPMPLDGRHKLGGHKLDGLWKVDGSWSLAYPTLLTIGQPRLDGTWRLGVEPGLPGVWFTAVATVRRGGATYREVL